MATIYTYRCDRCGAKGVDQFKKIKAYTMDGENRFISNAVKSIDVCQNCFEKIFSEEKQE